MMMIVCLDAILDVGEAERSANLIETAAAPPMPYYVWEQ